MAFYSIGDVAERCGINPVTLRAWQRRYGLLKPQRSEGGHRQFDEEDIQRIEEIKRWIDSGVPVGKVKALLEESQVDVDDGWGAVQEALMTILRQVRPARLRETIEALGRTHSPDIFIDHILVPVRKRLTLDQTTALTMRSLLDGALLAFAISSIAGARKSANKEALLVGWRADDRTRLWLEAWRLSQQGWNIDVLAEPLESPRPELFPGQHLILWSGKPLLRSQQEQLAHWRAQGFAVTFHGA